MMTIKKNYSLVERIKRKGSLLYQLFPINHRIKYPILFDKLLERIHNLKTNYKYNKFYSIKVYQNLELNRKGSARAWQGRSSITSIAGVPRSSRWASRACCSGRSSS